MRMARWSYWLAAHPGISKEKDWENPEMTYGSFAFHKHGEITDCLRWEYFFSFEYECIAACFPGSG